MLIFHTFKIASALPAWGGSSLILHVIVFIFFLSGQVYSKEDMSKVFGRHKWN